MKKVYKALALAAGLFVGSMTGNAQYWTYQDGSPVDASSIQTGVDYALLPGLAASTGGANFLAGERFTDSNNLVEANLYRFEVAGTTESGDVLYYLRRKSGEYVAVPTNGQFYTNQVERAWKLVVKDAEAHPGDYQYERVETSVVDGEEQETTKTYTGIDAYLWDAHDNPGAYDFTCLTLTEADGAVVLVDPTEIVATSHNFHNFFTTYPVGNPAGAPGKSANYSRNSWVIYQAEALSALDGLDVVLQELFKGENLKTLLENYELGDGAGQYSQEKYDAVLDLWTRATAIVENRGNGATEAEINSLAEQLPVAYQAFVSSGKPLEAGYYIVYSMRPFFTATNKFPAGSNGTGYDDGALYDGSSVTAGDKGLRWTYSETDAVHFKIDTFEANKQNPEYAKFVWKVTKAPQQDNAGHDLFYFQSVETGNYIGTVSAIQSPVVMGEKASVAYTIAASEYFPGYFSFYSPTLPIGYDGDAPSPAEYSGLHTERANTSVVAWDWRQGGSCWKVIPVDEADVNAMLEALAPAKRLAALEELVKKSEDAVKAGKAYMAVDAEGKKIETATSGVYEPVDGLVTSGDQISSLMTETTEGQDPAALVDANPGTYFHTAWSVNGYNAPHFLQFQLAEAETDLLLKWVKRNGNNNNGAPAKVVIWGSNDEAALQANTEDSENEAGEVVVDRVAWKKVWTEVGPTEFTYPYEVTWSDGTTKANAAGTAYISMGSAYKYIRMEIVTKVNQHVSNNNAYINGAEFRVYKAAYDEAASVYNAVPAEVKQEMNDAIAAAKAVLESGEASQADVEALEAAYNKFMDNYPDPSKVTDAIAAAKTLVTAAEEGEGLGFYETGAKAEAEAVINSVETQLNKILNEEKRQPNVTEVANLLAELNAALEVFNGKFQVPTTGIYAIKSYSSNTAVAGRRMLVANSSRKGYVKMLGRKQENGTWGDDEDVKEKLGGYWQVTKVDGGYTYKNLFTGLYLAPYTETLSSRMVTQSEEPYVFALQFAKVAGAFNLVAKNEDVLNGTYVYMNAEPSTANLVFWNSASGRDNSAFTFEPIEGEVETLLDAGFLYDVPAPGKAQIMTFPIALENTEDFYTVIGQDADNKIQLKEVTGGIEAGQAYVYKPSSDEATVVLYPVAKTVAELAPTVKEAQPVNGLVPVFETTKLEENNGRFNSDYSMVLLSEKNETVAANTGYFTTMPATEETGADFIQANGKISGTISAIDNLVVITKSADKGIYTIAGVRVKNVNSLPAGLYIVNGQKVLVK